jgi:hypothetical protein
MTPKQSFDSVNLETKSPVMLDENWVPTSQ